MYISPQLINRNELLLVYVYKMWEGKQGSRKTKLLKVGGDAQNSNHEREMLEICMGYY